MVNKYELYKLGVVSLQFNLRFSEVVHWQVKAAYSGVQ